MSEKLQNVDSPPSSDAVAVSETYAPIEGLSKKGVLMWRLKLMVALILPVYLETLDYTGMHVAISLNFMP